MPYSSISDKSTGRLSDVIGAQQRQHEIGSSSSSGAGIVGVAMFEAFKSVEFEYKFSATLCTIFTVLYFFVRALPRVLFSTPRSWVVQPRAASWNAAVGPLCSKEWPIRESFRCL